VCASIIAIDVSCFFINLVTFYEREGERGETWLKETNHMTVTTW
jgi:hypothetical protein